MVDGSWMMVDGSWFMDDGSYDDRCLILFQQNKFLRLAECAGLQSVEINTARKFTSIEFHLIIAGGFFLVDESRYFAA